MAEVSNYVHIDKYVFIVCFQQLRGDTYCIKTVSDLQIGD